MHMEAIVTAPGTIYRQENFADLRFISVCQSE
jgi:hypothetical protein